MMSLIWLKHLPLRPAVLMGVTAEQGVPLALVRMQFFSSVAVL